MIFWATGTFLACVAIVIVGAFHFWLNEACKRKKNLKVNSKSTSRAERFNRIGRFLKFFISLRRYKGWIFIFLSIGLAYLLLVNLEWTSHTKKKSGKLRSRPATPLDEALEKALSESANEQISDDLEELTEESDIEDTLSKNEINQKTSEHSS